MQLLHFAGLGPEGFQSGRQGFLIRLKGRLLKLHNFGPNSRFFSIFFDFPTLFFNYSASKGEQSLNNSITFRNQRGS